EALRAKGGITVPHTLVMSATPIPRTVAMTVFADLDVSTLGEMPAGIKHISTFAVSIEDHKDWLPRALARVQKAAEAGRGTFAVLPRIERSDIVDPESGDVIGQRESNEDFIEKLQRSPQLQGLSFGLLHGRMSTEEKDRVMQAFPIGDIDILVSPTVIE
ncbi:ATP-dependent DNA helicase RecG, partial [Burkholderia multivorans]